MADENGERETTTIDPPKPRLLQQVRDAVRRKHFSPRTEETYIHLIRRYIYFHGKRHPAELGEAEVTAFLNHLARDRKVGAATQNQALSALLFLYRDALAQPLAWLDGLDRAKRPVRVPSVLTRDEEAQRSTGLAALNSPQSASLLAGYACSRSATQRAAAAQGLQHLNGIRSSTAHAPWKAQGEDLRRDYGGVR